MQTIALVNPSRRSAKRRGASHLKKWQFKSNPAKRRKRSRSRSRGGGGGFVKSFKPSLSSIQPMLLGAAQGAAGALAVNAIVRYAPLPEMLITGRVSYLTRAALALGVGFVAANVVPNRVAQRMAEGALTVIAVDALRDLILSTTGYSLGGVGYYSPAQLVRGRRPAGAAGVGKQLTAVSNTGKYLNTGMSGSASRGAAVPGYGMPGRGW